MRTAVTRRFCGQAEPSEGRLPDGLFRRSDLQEFVQCVRLFTLDPQSAISSSKPSHYLPPKEFL